MTFQEKLCMGSSSKTRDIHVCSWRLVEATLEETGACHLVTLLSPAAPMVRPSAIAPHNHLHLLVADIVEPMEGHIAPEESHVRALLAFSEAWYHDEGGGDGHEGRARAPLLIHCYAGVSRSTAAAFITACALQPQRDEHEIAAAIRAKSATATPNIRLVALADAVLGRGGRMVRAVEAIGRGRDCFEGLPFSLVLET